MKVPLDAKNKLARVGKDQSFQIAVLRTDWANIGHKQTEKTNTTYTFKKTTALGWMLMSNYSLIAL